MSNAETKRSDPVEALKVWLEMSNLILPDDDTPIIVPARLLRNLRKMDQDTPWLPWGGGECPVSVSTPVIVQLRFNAKGSMPVLAGKLRWSHTGCYGDIVAYRLA